MTSRLLVDSAEFWEAFAADVRAARRRVLVQVLSFEGGPVGTAFVDLLSSVPSAVDRRIVSDAYPKHILQDKFVWGPSRLTDARLRDCVEDTAALQRRLAGAGIGYRQVCPFGPLWVRISARSHRKIFLVDDVAYVGGINVSDHNFAWHDAMVRLTDPVLVEGLAASFETAWRGERDAGVVRSGADEIHFFDGRTNPAQWERILDLLRGARRSVFVQSPYLSFPFFDVLHDLANRGVAVTVLGPGKNNWSVFEGYGRHEARKSPVDVRVHRGARMSHLKAILIDESTLLLGSANFDYFAYTMHQELVAVLRDPALVADFMTRVRDRDLAESVPAQVEGAAWRTRVAHALCVAAHHAMHAVNRLDRRLTPSNSEIL